MDYYVSPDGSDSNDGLDPSSALRSLTRAIALIAEAYEESDGVLEHCTVNMAAGVYSRENGEQFPIIVPPDVRVQGESRDTTEIVYSYPPDAEYVCGATDTTLEVYGAVWDVSLNRAGDGWGPALIPACLNSADAVVGRVRASIVWVDAAMAVSESEVDIIYTLEGLEQDGQLYPVVSRCEGEKIFMSGGRLQQCTIREINIASPSRTILANNQIQHRCSIYVVRDIGNAPPNSEATTPQILYNTFHSLDALEEDSGTGVIWIAGESIWRGNTIFIGRLGISCDSTFEDNQITACRVEVRHPVEPFASWSLSYMIWRQETEVFVHQNSPIFHNNTFNQGRRRNNPRTCSCYRCQDEYNTFLTISSSACPIFENNTFNMSEDPHTQAIVHIKKYRWTDTSREYPDPEHPERFCSHPDENCMSLITHLLENWIPYIERFTPNPDFGGGGRSSGGNVFNIPYSYSGELTPHMKITVNDDEFTLYAQNNTWSFAPNVEVTPPGTNVTIEV